MSLQFEYFKSRDHIIDLQRLKDRELINIIRLFQEEKKNFKYSEGCHLEGLNNAFIKMKDLFKGIRFILVGYINVINENDLAQCDKNEINYLLTCLDEIEIFFTKIKYIKKNKKKVNDLMFYFILKIRELTQTLSEFIYNESYLWESDLNNKKF